MHMHLRLVTFNKIAPHPCVCIHTNPLSPRGRGIGRGGSFVSEICVCIFDSYECAYALIRAYANAFELVLIIKNLNSFLTNYFVSSTFTLVVASL